MTAIAGFVRPLLILLGTFSTIMLAKPCNCEEIPKSDPTVNSSKTKRIEAPKDKPISELESDSEPKSKKPSNLSETQHLYLGNKFSQKYHLKGCHFAEIAQPGNIFPFASCKEAINSNYLPCNWCLPKWQKFVKGEIIGLPINRKADAKKSSSQ